MPYEMDRSLSERPGETLAALRHRRFVSVTEYLEVVEHMQRHHHSEYRLATSSVELAGAEVYEAWHETLTSLPSRLGTAYVDERFPDFDLFLDLRFGDAARRHEHLTDLIQRICMWCLERDCDCSDSVASVPESIKETVVAIVGCMYEIIEESFNKPDHDAGVFDRALYEKTFGLNWLGDLED